MPRFRRTINISDTTLIAGPLRLLVPTMNRLTRVTQSLVSMESGRALRLTTGTPGMTRHRLFSVLFMEQP